MAITLGMISLPDGLRWSDEYAWQQLNVGTDYSLTGALIVQTATRQAGRPISLVGGQQFCWATKAQLDTLQTALDTCTDAGLILTLHDGRTFTVMPVPPALSAAPLPVVGDSGPADPTASTLYSIDSLKLMEI